MFREGFCPEPSRFIPQSSFTVWQLSFLRHGQAYAALRQRPGTSPARGSIPLVMPLTDSSRSFGTNCQSARLQDSTAPRSSTGCLGSHPFPSVQKLKAAGLEPAIPVSGAPYPGVCQFHHAFWLPVSPGKRAPVHHPLDHCLTHQRLTLPCVTESNRILHHDLGERAGVEPACWNRRSSNPGNASHDPVHCESSTR